MKPSKCSFGKTSIGFLGHIVDKEGIRMDPERVKSIIKYPTPKCVRDIRSFLGLAGYHRQFVKGWSHITEPMTRLTKKNEPFNWTETQSVAFNKIKELI